ncbi:DUF2304 domain-containing protein [Actinosynnema sp. NPDC047251]|uniref:Uncharacterized protein n=1 Tax=Saccharothrix espanaensis (strain ATCC 51144 / DSM 44229 / JCM 9112 / NBRC 15066 / NRRL 15764) TaxID=1179773 RepID=K0JPV8_SACES|nr:DUF2304 domain-containing protein [Saccharothrix espanaensis]CCH27496.1 hypothetical protein BN6_01630 [Saccharothrix espanaensis DSM 44229]
MASWRLMSIIVAVLVLLLVFEMMRRRKLREKYAAIWLLLAVLVTVLAAVPGVPEFLTNVTGIITPSNFVLFFAVGVLGLVALHLATEVGRLEEEVRTAIEEIALQRTDHDRRHRELEQRLQDLERVSGVSSAEPRPSSNRVG